MGGIDWVEVEENLIGLMGAFGKEAKGDVRRVRGEL